MNFTQSIGYCFSNYANFNGRGRRSEFWWFVLFTWMLSLGGSIMDTTTTGTGYGTLYYITAIVTFIPSIAAGARRLHDVNKSGWWQLIMITIVGIIPLVIWMTTEGEKKKNQFGPPIKLKK